MVDPAINKVLVEKGAVGYALTEDILQRLPDTHVEQIADAQSDNTDEMFMGKGTLHLMTYKGKFLKPCPGTRNYICCGYQILNFAMNCPLNCSYCILQSYFNQPNLRVFVNLRENLKQVLQTIDDHPERIFRIGTGEFTDSLALDDITGTSDLLVPEFSKRKNVILELKTKTDHIQRLLASRYRDRIILSWSLNSPYISTHEEHRAISLEKRLKAARACQSEGFAIGFHFDPLVYHHNWKDGYSRTVELMDKYIDPKGIIWISLGAFRYMPELKSVIRKRHPNTCVLDGEFIPGLDGKMRYFKPIRIDLFTYMREKLETWHRDTGLYLCMESDDIWQKSLGWSPERSAGLKRFLDQRVEKFFG